MVTDSQGLRRGRARVTSQGQITVPKAVRDALGLRPGDEIEFVPRGADLLVEVRPKRSVLDFAGVASHAGAAIPPTAEEIDELIERGMTDAAIARSAGTRVRSRRPR